MRHSTAVIAQARRSIRGAIPATTSSAQARSERGIWPRREAVAKRSIFVAATAAAWLIAYAAPVAAQAPALLPKPQIKIDYLQPKNISTASDPTQYNRYMTIYAWLRVRRPLDEIQKFLAPLRLPRQITIQVDTCGAQRRPYISGGPSRSAMS